MPYQKLLDKFMTDPKYPFLRGGVPNLPAEAVPKQTMSTSIEGSLEWVNTRGWITPLVFLLLRDLAIAAKY